MTTSQRTTEPFSLQYVKTIGLTSNLPTGRGFIHPVGLTVAQDGRIFVLSRGALVWCRVAVCNLEEDYLYEFGSHGDGDGQFKWATAIAMDSEERVYVADEYLHRITIFDASGKFLDKWGEQGGSDGCLDGPSGIAFDTEDNMYVVDQHNNRVQKFTAEGEHLLSWGSFGSRPGQFNLPWGIGLNSRNDVYVADWRNDRIQTFSPEGRFLASLGDSGQDDGQLNRPSGVAVDSYGNTYVADWGNERVQVFGPDGGFLQKLRGQATLSKWAEEFFAANPDEKRPRDMSDLIPNLPKHLESPYYESTRTEPYFWGPVSVTLDHADYLYVVEHSRHRFQVYRRKIE